MNWKKLFTSPPPQTVWLLDESSISLVVRDRGGEISSKTIEVSEPIFELGPVGLHGVDGELLEQCIGRIVEATGKPKRSALILPTGWTRSHLLDFDHLPRSTREVEEVVRWRLKKLLPVRPNDLRLSISQVEKTDGQQRIVCLTAVDNAISELERCFAACGIQLGLISGRVFALASAMIFGRPGANMVVQHEKGFLNLLLGINGDLRLIRMKPLSPGGPMGETVERELSLVWALVERESESNTDVTVTVSCSDPEIETGLLAWFQERDRVRVKGTGGSEAGSRPWTREIGSAAADFVLAVIDQEAGA
jgi:hypothetical protein